jgi:histidinol phosphatase-like PHP family hydrolase
MKTDLHIHTWCSTGTQTPEGVVQEAVSKGIGLICISEAIFITKGWTGAMKPRRSYSCSIRKKC